MVQKDINSLNCRNASMRRLFIHLFIYFAPFLAMRKLKLTATAVKPQVTAATDPEPVPGGAITIRPTAGTGGLAGQNSHTTPGTCPLQDVPWPGRPKDLPAGPQVALDDHPAPGTI